MFENQLIPFKHRHVLEDCSSNHRQFHSQYNTALNHFKTVRIKGIIFRFLAKVVRRKPDLYDLSDIKPGLNLHGSHYAGIKVVPIDSIVGTEGKAFDFDRGFHPRSEGTRERWVNMAMVYLCCFTFPPVQLTQMGDVYFVRDGHHRISVARAFGQMSIDAEVVTWNASPPFPWQPNPSINNTHTLQQADRLSSLSI